MSSTSSTGNRRMIRVIAEFPDGAAISELEPHFDLSRRSLQRRLKKLVEEGEIRREGKGRGTRYFAPAAETFKYDGNQAGELPSEPAFSDDAKRARHRIQKPPTGRTPVSYRRSFLGDYEPGQTYYLSGELREKLRRVGSVTDRQLPVGTYARRILDRLLSDLSWNSSRLRRSSHPPAHVTLRSHRGDRRRSSVDAHRRARTIYRSGSGGVGQYPRGKLRAIPSSPLGVRNVGTEIGHSG